MDINRARQIIDSDDKINVLYQGSPVWIEGVSDNNVAEIVSLKGHKARIEVPVNMLEEQLGKDNSY